MFLVTGGNGQLASCLKALGFEALYAGSDTLDIRNELIVKDFIKNHKISVIINCAAYTAVDKAETDPQMAYAVNALGAENLAKTGIPLIHISTDYVFDGTNHKPYMETDTPSPLGVYGQTKYQGEQAILTYANHAVIIRTSWLYSEFKQNFVKTMVRLGQGKESLNVVSDQIGSPTYAMDLASVMIKIAHTMQENPEKNTKELYHYSNNGVCSWYDFAQSIMKLQGLNCLINPIRSKDYPTSAKRPFYTVLDKTKITKDYDIQNSHWQESLEKCLKNLS